ncbi:hydantoinase B/oxoprolinase family protein [Acuticoccus sp. I52.16.1]|uniref:hydantoinase B/oxoprolinase family protein n=1 Tax=Acuticoccus sp. I52.16.1 TaxID=2928472 RepID=UPI001FD2C2FB|nr:hydantoinase B/oxoprolinase family protein [Acuticoccus sp. I52.16.1]UOM35692.1 hydantoinase B/oxoprolinase family protein [Acuticoccus sp. I52.16.1]
MDTHAPSTLSSIDLQIQWSRLISIMDEADVAMLQSAFSTIVSDSRDYAVILLDSQARSIAQAQVCVPAFTTSLPVAARTMLAEYPPETLQPGDVLITNDPWICHGHLPDFYVIVPMFHAGEIFAYYAAAAHMSDIGGRLDELIARDVFEEGLRVPPSKLYEAGVPNRQLFRIIENNVRHPRLVLGDVGAMVGAGKVVADRCAEFIADYGPTSIDMVGAEILSRSETAMREAIAALPDGVYRKEVDADGFGEPVHIALKLTIAGDTLEMDFAGSSPQREGASINCVYNVTHAHSIFALKCAFLPDLPNNEGLYAPITTVAPLGSVLNARFPAPVKARSMTSFHLHTAIFGAMVGIVPDQVQAAAGSFWVMACTGVDDEGEPFAIHVLPNGGTGAVSYADGQPTMSFPGQGTITPAEIIENRGPMLVKERSLREGSGGAGRRRGGLGQTIRLTTLGDAQARVTLRADKVTYPPTGLEGGGLGGAGKVELDGKPFPLDPFILKPGQELALHLPGGGGYGDPTARDKAALKHDVDMGFVSPADATTIYGGL